LESAYPLVHKQMTRNILASYSYVYTWKGTDTSLQPIILMAHYDVVPVEPSAIKLWTAKPFGGEIKNDSIYGRGAADDKGSMISIMESAESLLKAGFTPRRTIMLCFGHNEESTGDGAKAIVAWLQQQKIRAEMVIDEGGELTFEKVKDVSRPIAMIGVGEKGYATFELSVEKTGGHSSRPDRETAIDILAKALVRVILFSAPGCQWMTTSTSLKRPALTIYTFPEPPSSAGHPYTRTVPLSRFSSISFLISMPAATEAVPNK
jgi:carboxypeptidase PM20D1